LKRLNVVTDIPAIKDLLNTGYVGVISCEYTGALSVITMRDSNALILFSNTFSYYDSRIDTTGE